MHLQDNKPVAFWTPSFFLLLQLSVTHAPGESLRQSGFSWTPASSLPTVHMFKVAWRNRQTLQPCFKSNNTTYHHALKFCPGDNDRMRDWFSIASNLPSPTHSEFSRPRLELK